MISPAVFPLVSNFRVISSAINDETMQTRLPSEKSEPVIDVNEPADYGQADDEIKVENIPF